MTITLSYFFYFDHKYGYRQCHWISERSTCHFMVNRLTSRNFWFLFITIIEIEANKSINFENKKWKYQLVFVFRHIAISELNFYPNSVFAGQSFSSWISYFIRNGIQAFINPLDLAQISNRQTREDYLENFRWQVYQRLLKYLDELLNKICANLRQVWHLNDLAK